MISSKRFFRYFTYIEPIARIPIIKTYGSLILTILTLTIFTLFAIKPTIETIVLLQKKLDDQRKILSQVDKKIADLRSGIENYKAIDPNIRDRIENAVPGSVSISSIIESLELSANQSQASISALQFQPVTLEKPPPQSNKETLSEVLFTFNIEGSYQTQKQVLQNLRRSSRLISITNLIFNKTEGGNLLMSVSGKSYYLK